MSKQRMVNTRFWSDSWVRENLNPLDRYLFLYLLTNEHTNISGIYELSLYTMAFETGIEKDELTKSMLRRLEPKCFYIDGWVCLPNFIKHQNQKSPKIQVGIKSEMAQVPKHILENIQYIYGIDTPMYSNSNSNLNITVDTRAKKHSSSKSLSWEKVETHKLFEPLKLKYPNRDYRYEFDLMMDWWSSNRPKLPQAFSAYSKWISGSKEIARIQQEVSQQWITGIESAIAKGIKVDTKTMEIYNNIKLKESSKS